MMRLCVCQRGTYESPKHTSCYHCFVDRHSEYVECIYCGRWHSPKFAVCFVCRSKVPEREEAGAILRREILARDQFACRYCGNGDGFLQVDHVYPCRRGGTADPWNLQTLCLECNQDKGARYTAEDQAAKETLIRAYFTTLRCWLSPQQRDRLRTEVNSWRQRHGRMAHSGVLTQREYPEELYPEQNG
jgi:5-methylcytosine-specific restriction endonuclease McrA